MSILVLQHLGILDDGSAAVEDTSLDVRHVLAETVVLIANLESQFAGVAHDQDRALAGDGFDLLKGGQDEHSRLTETGLGLADDITTEKSLRNAVLLD